MYYRNNDTLIISILQSQKVKHREVKTLAQGLTADLQCCWDVNSEISFQGWCISGTELPLPGDQGSGAPGADPWVQEPLALRVPSLGSWDGE